MLNDIVGIKISGANYTTATDLKVFNPKDDNSNKSKIVKGTILYGRNGSGKSTIAKSFKKLAGEDVKTINKSEFFDIDNKDIIINDTEAANIVVFDEEYVDRYVKLKENGLGSIVMLGDLVDVTEELDNAQKDFDNAQSDNDAKQIILKEYRDHLNEKSPYYYQSKMNIALSGDMNWSGREREIDKSRRNNAPVYDNTYKQFIKLAPTQSRDQLIVEYNDKIKALREIESGTAKISDNTPKLDLSYKNFDTEALVSLVNKKIEKPQLSERERYLLNLVQNGKSDVLQSSIAIFSKCETTLCPTCLQEVTQEYKKGLIASIEKILSKVVENHKKELRSFLLQPIDMDFSAFTELESSQNCIDSVTKANEIITANNFIINSKISNPYSVPCEQIIEFEKSINELDRLLEMLDNELKQYNKKIADTKPLIQELRRINSEIAYYDIKTYHESYIKQLSELNIAEEQANNAENVLKEKKEALQQVELKRKKTIIAHDLINDALKYIFFSDNRLQIKIENDEYILLVNGHQVKPSEVSVGERNILGLCYFFASMQKNKEKNTAYKDEYIIVIDDPISSFDFENKIGILSYLKLMLGKYLTQNKETKALILTHDLTTFFDLEKIFDEILSKCKSIYNCKDLKFNMYELKNQKIEVFKYKKRQEYTELINIIYNYAKGNGSEYEIVIGNIMRQVLEAFSTFVYKKGIEEVSTDGAILSTIDEKYRDYFENLMYRLVLHGGSHKEEQARNLEIEFFSLISEEEKKRTAKDVLSFIYLLNPQHIISHISDADQTTLDKWCNDIISQ